jgi:hypothetical protein
MLVIAVLYYAFLCLIWLSVTVMYLLRKEFTFAGLITFGIFIVFILFYRFNIDIITSQVIALTIVSIATWVIVIIYFRIASKKAEKGYEVVMQKKSVMLYTLKPYFIYGFLYFTFLYMDRIVSWSSNSIYMPYVFWFRGQYELGLDFALLILILPMGICEVLVSGLMEKIDIMQKQSQHEETRFTKESSIAYYIRSLVTIFISAVVSAIFITLLIIYLHRYGNTIVSAKLAMFFNPVTIFVYIFGVISYCLLSISLTNIVIQFSLSQPGFVIRNLAVCLGVNFVVGFVFSRWFGYYWGIMGLLAGTILLAILTTKDMLKIMNKADYYIYAAA